MESSLVQFMRYAGTTHFMVQITGLLAFCYILIVKPLKTNRSNTILGSLIIGAIVIYRLAMQPIGWGTGGDRENYAYRLLFSTGNVWESMGLQPDPMFTVLSNFLYKVTDLQGYFWMLSFMYIAIYLFAAKRLSGPRIVWMFIALIVSFGFLPYGYNTIRAGLAISLLLLGMSFTGKRVPMALCLLLSVAMHMSMIIPVLMFLASQFYPKTRLFFILWIVAIPLSFFAGDAFNTLFSTFSDDGRTQYLTAENEGYNIGFRIDFIVYSLLPLAVGYYYIFKRGFKSLLYTNIYNTYVLTNIFWVLVIRANFSDRFAYLSWFLIPVILVYPLLSRPNIVRAPNACLAIIILGETLFSFLV